MSRQGLFAGQRIAIPWLGAFVIAALVLDPAWSQSPTRPGSPQTAQVPLSGPAFTGVQPPPSEPAEPAQASTEARFPLAQRTPNATPSEAVTPLEQEVLEDYTVPLRRPSDGMALDSEDGLISLVARNASLQDVLTALAETQGLNLITQESVNSQLNTTLHRLPFEDVLDIILSTSGFTWIRNRNVIQVTSVANSQNLAPETQGRLVEVFQLDYVSATDVSTVVQTMLSPAGSANVILADPKDNRKTQELLVVQDLPNYLDNIRNYIRKHDVPPRQVLIEAYILKVELSDETRCGINFDYLFNMSSNIVHIESRGFANPAAKQGFVVNLSGGNLAGVIEMLETTTDAKTLASPKIRVLNGQTARIQVGEQLGFRITTTTQTSTLESVQFLEVGVVLDVTPRISSDGTVIMHVSPEVSSGQVNANTGLPEEKTTELETDVMFRDNQAYIVGGLIQETDTDAQQKVPWLGDLKYVGHLFRHSEVVKRRSEVIIALLPRVLPFDPATNDQLLIETDQAMTPLLYGPLLEYPRPWEAQLPDAVKNPILLRLPSTRETAHFKGDVHVTPKPALEPIEAVNDTARGTHVPRDFAEPAGYTSQRPDSSGAIGTYRMSRLPAPRVTQPMGSGITAPPPGAMLR